MSESDPVTKTISSNIIPSALPGYFEIQPGEEVKISLKPTNPAWPKFLRAIVQSPIKATKTGRDYTVQFDKAHLNGGPEFSTSDIASVGLYTPMDAFRDEMQNPPPPAKIVIHGTSGKSTFAVPATPAWENGAASVDIVSPQMTVKLRWDKGALALVEPNEAVTAITVNLLA